MVFIPRLPSFNTEVQVYKLAPEARTYALLGTTITGQIYTPQRTQDEDVKDTQYFVYPKTKDHLRGFTDFDDVTLGDCIVFGFPTNAPRTVGYMVRLVQPRWLNFPNEHLMATLIRLKPAELEIVTDGDPFPFEPVVDDDCHIGSIILSAAGTDALDIEDFRTIRIMATDPDTTIRGIAGGTDCRRFWVWNIGSESITFEMDSGSAALTNRIRGFTDEFVLAENMGAFAWYDPATHRWRIQYAGPFPQVWRNLLSTSSAVVHSAAEFINCDTGTGLAAASGNMPGTVSPAALLSILAATASQQGAVSTLTQTWRGLKRVYDGIAAIDELAPRLFHGTNSIFDNRVQMVMHFNNAGTPTTDQLDLQLNDAQQIGGGAGKAFGYGGTINGVIQPRIFFHVNGDVGGFSNAGMAVDGVPGVTGGFAFGGGYINFIGGIVYDWQNPTVSIPDDFTDLTDVPSSYSGAALMYLRVNAGGTAIEFVSPPSPGPDEFTELTDCPSSYSGAAGLLVAVNVGETGLEFITPPATGPDEFIELTDVPSTYAGAAGTFVAVNATETGLEFVAPPMSGVDEFIELTDCPSSYSGAASNLVAVNSGGSGLEFLPSPMSFTSSAWALFGKPPQTAIGSPAGDPKGDMTTGIIGTDLVDTGDATINDNFATVLALANELRQILYLFGFIA